MINNLKFNRMKKILKTIMLVTFYKVTIFAQCSLNKQGWTLIFNEEFNTNITDLKTRWKIFDGTSSNQNDWFRSIEKEANITLSGGNAYFATNKLTTPITIGGLQYNYTTAQIISKFDDIPFCSTNSNAGYLYGMFEIRCKLPKKAGQYPAYWLYGNTAWPPEIDVFEFNGSTHDNFFSTVHWGENNNPQSCGNTYYYPFDLTDDFHTWTIVWTPTIITWFFDGKELKTDNVTSHVPGATSPSMWERCNWRKMNHQIGSYLNWPNSTETTFDPLIVDYIKVFKPTGYNPFTTGNFDFWHDSIVKPLYQNTSYKSTQDWIINKVISSDSYNSLSDMNVLQGGNKFFYKGDYNLLWNTYWYDWGNGYQFYSAPINGNNTVDGNISVATNPEIPFFRKGNQIQYYQYSSFYTISGVNNVQSTILANPNGLQVIYLGTNNNIWQCKRNNITSNTWTVNQLTNTGNVTSEIIFDNNNYNIIYFKNTSSRLIKLTFSGTPTTSVISTENDVFSSLAINPTSNKIYYKTSANKLLYYEQSGTTWTRNVFNAISPYSGTNSVPIDNVLKNICIAENPHQIYYIGTDNRVWIVYWDGTWRNTAIDWKVNYASRDLRITNPTTSNKTLSFVGNDNQIRRLYFGTCEVLNPPCNGNQYFRLKDNSIIEPEIKDISLYPNPANDFIELEIPNQYVENCSIEIYTIGGQFVKKIEYCNQKNNIAIPDLPIGLYIIKVSNNSSISIMKFYKN